MASTSDLRNWLVAEGYLDAEVIEIEAVQPPAPVDNPAGRCMVRLIPGQLPTTYYHDQAPPGITMCSVCDRAVYRGDGALAFTAIMRTRYGR